MQPVYKLTGKLIYEDFDYLIAKDKQELLLLIDDLVDHDPLVDLDGDVLRIEIVMVSQEELGALIEYEV